MKNTPEKIYLQLEFEPDKDDDFKKLNRYNDVTWSDHRINESDLEYGFIPKPTKADKVMPWIGVFLISVVISLFLFGVWYKNRPHITQDLFIDAAGESSFPTLVWAEGHIVKSWWDSIEITDSLKKVRMAEAQRILKTIK